MNSRLRITINSALNWPYGIDVDDSGNIYFAGVQSQFIHRMDASGKATTVAGNGQSGFSGDGGLATDARLSYPTDVAVDRKGNIYIADTYSNRIRKVDTQGIIRTVAGNGQSGFSGDGGPAIDAEIQNIEGIEIDDSGNLYIACFNRIRKVGKIKLPGLNMAEDDLGFPEKTGIGHVMDASGRHKKTVDLNTGAILNEFGYDADNRLISITDEFGSQITIERDTGGVPTAIISPYGVRTELTIDANNHLTQITYPDGSYYTFDYTLDGLLTLKTQPEGNQFGHIFDSDGRITDFTDDEGGHWRFSRKVLENGDLMHETLTGESNLTSYMDSRSLNGAFASTITDPSGAQIQFTSSDEGLSEGARFSCGEQVEIKYSYDSKYKFKYVKERKEIMPSGLQRIVLNNKAYQDDDSDGIADRITDSVTINDKAFTLLQDISQSTKTSTSPEGRVVSFLYNPITLTIQNVSISGLYDTAFTYDLRGRITSQTTNTRQTTFSYVDDANGHQITITDPQQQPWIYNIDPMDRLSSVQGPDGGQLQFTYDKNGNMTVLTNPVDAVDVDHGFGFNAVNLNSSYQTPLSGSYSYIYDKDRRLIQTNFPSGNIIFNDYTDPDNPDDKSRLRRTETPEDDIYFTYLCGTKVGSITKVPKSTTQDTESIEYDYDGKLVISETLAGTLNQSIGYTYNNDFGISSFTYSGGTVSYSYDNDGLLTGAGSFTITRNADNGLPETVTDGALNLGRSFSGYGEVGAQAIAVSSQNVAAWSLTRDNNGRITAKTETVDGETSGYVYTYDAVGRLLTVSKDSILVEEYQYDLNGTRIYEMNSLRGIAGRSYSYSDEDHLLSAGLVTYDYDWDGFLTTRTDGDDVTTYNYSSRGELLRVDLRDGRVIEYVHDPLGRRIAKKVDGIIIEKYLWQGLTRLLAVYDGSDTVLMQFEYADDRMPVAVNAEGVTYYLAYDQVGSLRLVADSAGNVIKSIEYDSFGNLLSDSDPTFAMPLGFAGGLHDRDTGLVRFGYRDYDADVGRWTAKDPIGFAGGDTDLYGYVLNDPINFVDPDGRAAFIATGIIGGVSGAFSGAVSGLQHGNIGSAIAGGLIGGIAGAFVGTFNPFGSSAVGTLAGSMAAGFVGGFAGGGAGAKLAGACPDEIYESATSGAMIGAISGAAAAPLSYLGGIGVVGSGYAPWVGEAVTGIAAESIALPVGLIGSSM
ncbi:hypothetical protein N9893_01935 [bacterium]|nr:hypothetical protein [bacterium]